MTLLAELVRASQRVGHQGVMAKALDAPYEAGNRGASWLKIKRVNEQSRMTRPSGGGLRKQSRQL